MGISLGKKVRLYRLKDQKKDQTQQQTELFPDTTSNDPIEWVKEVRTIDGKPFTFKNREYLTEIYRSTAQEIDIVKGRQTEITEYALNFLLFNLIKHPMSIGLYVADRDSHTSIFSNLRLKDRALRRSPMLAKYARLKDHAATMMQFLNGSYLFMYSAWDSFDQARSIPADFAVVDEVQDTEVAKIDALKESMSHSKYKMLRLIGTGSEEGSDWNKRWMQGDQREWDFKAKAWVPKAKENSNFIHSYHLSQEMVPWITALEIDQKRMRSTSPRMFTTEVLGWWFRGAAKPLTTKDIYALFDKSRRMLSPDEVDYSKGPLIMGIDWGGGTKAYTIPIIAQLVDEDIPKFDIIYFDRITEPDTEKQADRCINLINDYDVNQTVMDAGGGTRQVQKLENEFASRTVKCSYQQRPQEPINLDHLYDNNLFVIDRTFNIESVIDLIKRPQIIPGYPHPIPRISIPAYDLDKVEWIVDQMTCIEAESVMLSSGKKYTRYTKPEGQPDDFLHAMDYLYDAYLVRKTGLDVGGRLLRGKF